jgi:hypothetical protein
MFRSQSKSKSLKVQRETVRVLAGSHLASAQGGATVFNGGVGGATGGVVVATVNPQCPFEPPRDINERSWTGNGCGATGGPVFTSGVSLVTSTLP